LRGRFAERGNSEEKGRGRRGTDEGSGRKGGKGGKKEREKRMVRTGTIFHTLAPLICRQI